MFSEPRLDRIRDFGYRHEHGIQGLAAGILIGACLGVFAPDAVWPVLLVLIVFLGTTAWTSSTWHRHNPPADNDA